MPKAQSFSDERRRWENRVPSPAQGVIKPLFCVLEDELLSASDELLRETGQPHHVVRSHNELNVA